MKNKSFTYVLLGVVAIIWYQVFFRVKDNLFSEKMLTSQVNPNSHKAIPIAERDTFILNSGYIDPFGKSADISKTKPNTLKNYNPNKYKKSPKPELVWPKINYIGLVKKSKSKNALAILNVEGSKYLIRKNDEIYNGIMVRKITRDSILITYNKQKKVYYRD